SRDKSVQSGPAVGLDHAAVGEQLARVVEHDDTVAKQAPALLRHGGDDLRRFTVGVLRGRARRLVLAQHRSSSGGIGGVSVALLMFSDARYYGQRHISVH